MDIIIVCHTEFGFVDRKRVIPEKNALAGVSKGVFNLIRVADKYGAKISFAVCPEVVKHFPRNINHEIGLHVHPGWQEFVDSGIKFYVGDKYLKENCKQSSSSTVLWDYSYEEQSDMIKSGKEYLIEELNITPKFFVAGRWCLNNDTVKALVANGFTHDCSASAGLSNDHMDWSRLSRICAPYNPSIDDYQAIGNQPLLIVPISQCFRIGSMNPELIPLIGLNWLKACFTEYYNQGAPLFHICLHSPSMTDEYFISGMEKLLSFISKHKNINFKFVSEIKKYPEQNFKPDLFPYILAINKNILTTFIRHKILKNKKDA